MSDTKKNSFSFDSDDSDQQILPFDFLEDEEEEEKPIETEIKKQVQAEKTNEDHIVDNTETFESPQDKTPEVEQETAHSLTDHEADKIEKFGPSNSDTEKNDLKKAESEKNEIEKDIKSAEAESKDKEIIPKTVKITAPEKMQDKTKTESAPKKEEKNTGLISTSGIKPGEILQEARVRKDLSLDQVAQATKIKKAYIEALETGDHSNLPAPVFVEAYIKNLCNLYDISSRQVMEGLVRQKPGKVVPGELLHHIEEGKQVNFEEEAKVNKIFKTVAIVILILALTIFIAIKLASPAKVDETQKTPDVAKPEPTGQVEPKITSEDLEIFLYHQPFTMTEMKLPEKEKAEVSDNI